MDLMSPAERASPAPALLAELADHGPQWLRALRERAWARHLELGLPSTREEAWRATDIRRLAGIAYRRAPRPSLSLREQERLRLALLPQLSEHALVFVDGHFTPELSRRAPLPPGVRLTTVGGLVGEDSGTLERLLAEPAFDAADALDALNAALFEDGAVLLLSAGARLEEPVQLVFASSGRAGLMAHPRSFVLAGADSRASVVESWVGLGEGDYFVNPTTRVGVGPRAHLEHTRLQFEGPRATHLARLVVQQQEASRFTSRNFALGGALARVEIGVLFEGEQASCELDGLYLARGSQLLDSHTRIDHARPRCTSREVYKGILDGRARGVFHGQVAVRLDASQTDASQVNQNLLLSEDAVVNTRPQLEILNDDVKCTHGAAVGRLDSEALFYLRSRGVGEAEARAMLVRAFAAEIVDRVPLAPLRDALEGRIGARLAGVWPEGVA